MANLQIKLLEWGHGIQGRRVRAPGGDGGQCVDVVNLWCIQVGAAHIYANAVDMLRAASPADWSVVMNTPTNAPTPGDVIVWHANASQGVGIYGHCAVALVASTHALVVLEQDWPYGAPSRWGSHPYDGVVGWLVRKAAP